MTIAYVPKVNQRPLGFELLIQNEFHLIGTTAVATSSPNQIRLIEVPLNTSPSTVIIPGFVETLGAPGTNQFAVNYSTGVISFNFSQEGNSVFVTYKGRGSLVDAEDVNELQEALGGIANINGTLTAGIVHPNNISVVNSDNFTFPNNVTITNDLLVAGNFTVNGTFTVIHTQSLSIEDPILDINDGNPTPLSQGGIRIHRDPISTNTVSLLWDEASQSWEIQNTTGGNIVQIFASGAYQLVVNGNGHVTGNFTVDGTIFTGPVETTEISSATNLTFGIDDVNTSTTRVFIWQHDVNSELMRLTEQGLLTIQGGMVVNSITALTSSLTFKPAVDTIDSFVFQNVAGTSVVTIDTVNNRLGINQAAPIHALDVVGKGNFSSDVRATAGGATLKGGTLAGITAGIDPTTQPSVVYDSTNTAWKIQGAGGSSNILAIATDSGFINIGSVANNRAKLDIAGSVYVQTTSSIQGDATFNSATATAINLPLGGGITVTGGNVVLSSGLLGVGTTTPKATLHNTGSTILGVATATNPSSITTANVDSFSGIITTLTTGNLTTSMPTPTNATAGRLFSVINSSASTSIIVIGLQQIAAGSGVTYIWNGSAWELIGSSGAFPPISGDPATPITAQTWFDTVTSQFKGWNGTEVVILG